MWMERLVMLNKFDLDHSAACSDKIISSCVVFAEKTSPVFDGGMFLRRMTLEDSLSMVERIEETKDNVFLSNNSECYSSITRTEILRTCR